MILSIKNNRRVINNNFTRINAFEPNKDNNPNMSSKFNVSTVKSAYNPRQDFAQEHFLNY